MSKIIKTKFKISGMNCGSCAMNIDFELEDLAGVISAKTSYAKGESETEFDEEKIDTQTIVRKINGLGYEVSMQ
jgi:copper chaperone CopZ